MASKTHDHKRIALATAGGMREEQALRNYCKVMAWDYSEVAPVATYCPWCDVIEVYGSRFGAGDWYARTGSV